MILFYCDESGNTGRNIADPSQPYHYLLALAVEESIWLQIVADYDGLIKSVMPSVYNRSGLLPLDFELHGTEIWNRKRHFRNLTTTERIALIEGACQIISNHNCEIVYGRCPKAKLAIYSRPAHPHWCAAFICLEAIARICTRVSSLAIVVADQCSETEPIVKDFVLNYKRNGPPTGTGQNMQLITDNVHFMRSTESVHMQLADIATWLISRNEKRVGGIEASLNPALRLVRRQVKFNRDFPY